MNEKASGSREVDGGRLVLWLTLGTTLAAAAAVAAFEAGRPEGLTLRMAEYDAATRHAPWLMGLYGSRGMKREAAGEAGNAYADYSRVLTVFPGHPGTSLARARVVEAGGAAAPAAARAQALADLDAAERGYRLQRDLAGAGAEADAGGSGGGAVPGVTPTPATDETLDRIAELRRKLTAAGDGDGK
ncbi:MAG: hypothetical protein HZA54_07365 [Planctomycetes bacterium]|nr:hypothetical protein [Planctomycetota bacterium]